MNSPYPRSDPTEANRPRGVGRSMTIFGAIAVGISLVGFLVGIAEPVVPQRAAMRASSIPPESATIAPSYREITSTTFGPNRFWTSSFTSLKQARPDLFAPVVRTPAMKDAALRDRMRTRAFDGAPPVVPHLVENQSSQNCLACHGDGMQLGDRIATKISHPHYANCLGCHVEQRGSVPFAPLVASANHAGTRTASEDPVNGFSGLPRTGPGNRAMLGAPPTIPHTTHLRGDCMSCHGLIARPGLRTSHPWLQNCVQCHAFSAEAERIPFFGPDSATATTPTVGQTLLSTDPARFASEESPP